jgi:hypothetical protein
MVLILERSMAVWAVSSVSVSRCSAHLELLGGGIIYYDRVFLATGKVNFETGRRWLESYRTISRV